MRKYLVTLALATFAFTVAIILFNGQSEQIVAPEQQMISKPSLRSPANGASDRQLSRLAAEDTDDSGIIEGVTNDDNSSDDGNRNPYEPVVADPSGWSDVETNPVVPDPVVEEVDVSPGTPEGEVEEVGTVIPVAGPIEGSDSDDGVTPGIVVEAPAPVEKSDSGEDSGRGVIEVQPVVHEAEVQPDVHEAEIRNPDGEPEVQDPITEGEVLEVELPTAPVTSGTDGGAIEISEPVIIGEPPVIETEVADPLAPEPVVEEIDVSHSGPEVADPIIADPVAPEPVIEEIDVSNIHEAEVADPVIADPVEPVIEENNPSN